MLVIKLLINFISIKFITVVDRILQQHQSNPFTLCGVKLRISELKPAPLPPILEGDIESDKLLVKQLPPDVVSKDLEQYLYRASSLNVKSISYSPKPGIAMVGFESQYGMLVCLLCEIWVMFTIDRCKNG